MIYLVAGVGFEKKVSNPNKKNFNMKLKTKKVIATLKIKEQI